MCTPAVGGTGGCACCSGRRTVRLARRPAVGRGCRITSWCCRCRC